MIDYLSMPVTEETRDKLYGLALAIAMQQAGRSGYLSPQEILEKEWQRVEDAWARKE